jgi:hypothetical protein
LAGHVAQIGEKKNAYGILKGKLERKRPLKRTIRRCLGNLKLDLGEIVWGVLFWIDMAKDRDH